MTEYKLDGTRWRSAYKRDGSKCPRETPATMDEAGETALTNAKAAIARCDPNGTALKFAFITDLHRCVQAHTSQADWTPDVTPALWTEVAKPGEIPVWKQPTGAQDAYNKGDRVWYPEKNTTVYESLIDANVYSPEAYPAGWMEV